MAIPVTMAILVSAMALVSGEKVVDPTYKYTTKRMDIVVDHFNFLNNDTFSLRYLVNGDNVKQGPDCPIFFYSGNEGDIEMFAQNVGLMWEWAVTFNAFLVFAEHRYYGDSLPRKGLKPSQTQYLTSEQALADFVDVITHVKETIPGLSNSPVITFGGSYGGMLSAWLRIKYPWVVQGALAASAPVLQFPGLTPCGVYNEICTKDFEKAGGEECTKSIKNSWSAIDRIFKNDDSLNWLSKEFRTCNELKASDIGAVKDWLSSAWGNLPMVDYPYPATFLGPLPAWPVNATCKFLKNSLLPDKPLLTAIFHAANVFYNYTGQIKCNNLSTNVGALDDNMWSYQVCTEMVMPMCGGGPRDMFPPTKWDMKIFTQDCQKNWGVTPRPDWIKKQFGAEKIAAASNIIFSNGELDPWSGGGVTKSLSDSLVAIHISGGAHHLDLRAANPADPPAVRVARLQEKALIRKWLAEYSHRTESAQTLVEWMVSTYEVVIDGIYAFF